MAKGAATEHKLGKLHDRLAGVFQKVLERYEARLQALDTVDPKEFESEVLEELFNDNAMPNPAMLSAVSKFLKDNDIGMDSEQVEALSSTARRLEERRKLRSNVVNLTNLPAAADG